VTTPLTLRPVSAHEHREFIAGRSSASFLQTPAWASVKSEWRSESVGWFRESEGRSEMVGVGLVLYRQLPKVKRYLAYLPSSARRTARA
jgi:vancomycin resistance protein VanK